MADVAHKWQKQDPAPTLRTSSQGWKQGTPSHAGGFNDELGMEDTFKTLNNIFKYTSIF